MAEDSDLERTQPASQRRLEQARERGEVPRSAELSTFAVLLAGGGGLMVFGAALVHSLEGAMRAALTLDSAAAFEPAQMMQRLLESAAGALVGVSPLFLLVAVVGLLTPMLVSGWLFTVEGLRPDFGRLDPLRGLGRILSLRGAVEMGKALLKILLVGGVAAWAAWSERAEIFSLFGHALEPALAHLGQLLGRTFMLITGAFALIVALDVAFQIWDHRRQLRMTRSEVREELKEAEGSPQIKARIRGMQHEVRGRRMAAAVRKADVIVANPTHYAVALRYRDDAMHAPRVIANGSLLLAERMVELAQAAGVPTLHAPALARALFAHAELGRDIPSALYTAVAEVLAWVYQLRRAQARGEEAPPPPVDVPVPSHLDPSAESMRRRAEHV